MVLCPGTSKGGELLAPLGLKGEEKEQSPEPREGLCESCKRTEVAQHRGSWGVPCGPCSWQSLRPSSRTDGDRAVTGGAQGPPRPLGLPLHR